MGRGQAEADALDGISDHMTVDQYKRESLHTYQHSKEVNISEHCYHRLWVSNAVLYSKKQLLIFEFADVRCSQ